MTHLDLSDERGYGGVFGLGGGLQQLEREARAGSVRKGRSEEFQGCEQGECT
jgi:hypothetical protein